MFNKQNRLICTGWLWCVGLLGLFVPQAHGQRATTSQQATILPSQFLRQYDPITVVFREAVGPNKAGPEDRGEQYLKVTPAVGGAYRWLDARTLEFRPAARWPALGRFLVSVPAQIKSKAGKTLSSRASRILRTLLPAPKAMTPSADSQDVKEVRKIQLTFAQKLPDSRLRQALRVYAQALPGVNAGLSPQANDKLKFQLKRIPATAKGAHTGYWLIFDRALPKARKVTVKLTLALRTSTPKEQLPMWEASFTTQQPFHLQKVRCHRSHVSLAWGKARYPQEQALDCGGRAHVPTLEFSRPLGKVNPGLLLRLVRFSPTVPGLKPDIQGNRVFFRGRYQRNVLYRMTVQASRVLLQDDAGQPLQHFGEQTVFFFLGKKRPFLRWERGKGLVERFGPQMMPLHTRGFSKVDLRIYAIKAGDRRFWPYPKSPVTLDEAQRPPGPGEAPGKPKQIDHSAMQRRVQAYLKTLGTPRVSKIVTIPKDPNGEGLHFGIDLAPHLKPYLAPKGALLSSKPLQGAHFLVGLRALDGSTKRRYVWVQLTDLALTTVEEQGHIRFIVTSLRNASPVKGATIAVEGPDAKTPKRWHTLWTGKTDDKGFASLHVKKGLRGIPTRIRVVRGGDQLLLDIKEPPPVFVSNHWYPSSRRWLSWATNQSQKPTPPKYRAHIFTERPVYRPNETVHVKALVRALKKGKMVTPAQNKDVRLVIEGPRNKRWQYNKLKLSAEGGLYRAFRPEDPPTGYYNIKIQQRLSRNKYQDIATRSFRFEEYKIPKFEVKILGKKDVPADKAFQVTAVGRYFSGGLVTERPVRWRVVARSIQYRPRGRAGYRFTSNYRFGRRRNSRTRIVLNQQAKLNKQGQASIKLDPTRHLRLQAMRYTVEATVTGLDGRDIAGRRHIRVLPPFSLGVKLQNRFRLRPGKLNASFIAVGLKNKLKAGVPLEVTLLRREWHSRLVETDFVSGGVKYHTDIVDRKFGHCRIKSANKAVNCPLTIKKSGVYILRVQARDRVGRLQTVSVDMYVRGKQQLAWERPESSVFKITPDQRRYRVGQTAKLLIRSPFQKARGLVITEDPSGTQYKWIDIDKGQGLFQVPIKAHHAPGLHLHVLLMRGRVANPRGKQIDPGRPRTVASSIKLDIAPRQHMLAVAMKLPTKRKPREKVEVELTLRDADGRPVSGEVTLWAVDRAVLSLGREGPLNPLKAFVKQRNAQLRVRDTRNQVLGRIAQRADNPGGGAGGDAGGLGRIIRRNFKSVAYYNPVIKVGPSGKVKVSFQLPDDLTTFAIRAVAVSGNRFGYRSKNLLVRLPVMILRALTRFVRPGDRFKAGGLARVVEGPGGPAKSTVGVAGLTVLGPQKRLLKLDPDKAVPVNFNFSVPRNAREQVKTKITLTRLKDKEGDAFEVKTPVRPDRRRVYVIKENILSAVGQPFRPLTGWPEKIRSGSGQVEVMVAGRGEVLRSIAALEYQLAYPYGCTEQRVSRAYPMLVLENTLQRFALKRLSSVRIRQAVKSTIRHLSRTVNRDGTFGFWPGSSGYVWLTAYTFPFLIEARQAGYGVPSSLINGSLQALRRSLRSDYAWRVSSAGLQTRAEVLLALARAGRHEAGYVRRLYSRRRALTLFAKSRLLLAMYRDRGRHGFRIQRLKQELWARVVFKQEKGGSLLFEGLRFHRNGGWYSAALRSRTRTLAGLLEALSEVSTARDQRKLDGLKRGLLDTGIGKRLGYGWQDGDTRAGWGNTHDNARALLALRAFLRARPNPLPRLAFRWRPSTGQGNWSSPQHFQGPTELWKTQVRSDVLPDFQLQGTAPKQPLWVRTRYSYIPLQPGNQTTPLNQGFSLTRRTQVVKQRDQAARFYTVRAGQAVKVAKGSLLEETVRVIVAKSQYNVAIEVPFAAGLEALNPALRITSQDAKTSRVHTLKPSHQEYLDDRVRFFFDKMPAGDHKLYFRLRATTQGQFTFPAAHVELMYRPTVFGRGAGYTLRVK